MTRPTEERGVEALWRRAERALDEGRSRKVVEPLLERLIRTAPAGEPACLFAHRHLAELRLELDPWSALLHLKKVVAANADDDIAHSLMALAHALLGNYRSAVRSYRHALRVSPANPWYHHNLGHLLDVALGAPRDALPHLEQALANARPPEHEITASAAHCLARVGRLEEAALLAKQALVEAPDNADHLTLLSWIEEGAPADRPVHPTADDPQAAAKQSTPAPAAGEKTDPAKAALAPAPEVTSTAKAGARVKADPTAEVIALVDQTMQDQGFTTRQREVAGILWTEWQAATTLRVKKPAVYAAVCHYAVAIMCGLGPTQREIAELYGVHTQTLGSRYADMGLHVDTYGGRFGLR